jgi:FMN phosphatase YigB (HAD superfamily)
MKEKIILTDCDGVLCDWVTAFNEFMARKGYPCLPNMEAEYNLALRHNQPPEIVGPLMREFIESPIIGELTPYADSVKYVKKLADLGFRFIVVTSIGTSEACHHYRSKNLRELFGDVFDEVNCIESGASKAHILERWAGTGYFWFEDHMRQAEAGYEVGLKAVLLNHPYNEKYLTDLFPRLMGDNPWEQIYEMVCKEYGITTV